MTEPEDVSADAAAVASCSADGPAQATLQPTSPVVPSGKPGAQAYHTSLQKPHVLPWGGEGGLPLNSVTIHQTGLVRRGKKVRPHGH